MERRAPVVAAPSCGGRLAGFRCAARERRAVVTLSFGKRSHFAITRVPMEACAAPRNSTAAQFCGRAILTRRARSILR